MNIIDHDFSSIQQVIPEQQPMVQALVDDYRHRRPLHGVTALLIQHQLGNHVCQARALIDLGLDPEKIYWLDIPYTSNQTVREALMKLDIPAGNFITHKLRLLDFYALEQRSRVHDLVNKLLQNAPDRLLVLDDGAYFLESLMCFEADFPELAIVEQTTRGLIKIEGNPSLRYEAMRVPIIDVASSPPKKILEPPFIGKAVCRALQNKLGDHYSGEHQQQCLILGYGDIGRKVSQFVWEQLGFRAENIHVFDPAIKEQNACPFPLWHRDDLESRFDLVIGCSGRASFGVGDFVFLNDGAVLASASSGSVELSRRKFIELAMHSDGDIWIDQSNLDINNIHSDIPVHFPGRDVTFVNGGFPVNFSGEINCLPAKYIQPTVAMMVRAAIQAVETDRKGIVPLDEEFCKQLDKDFRELLGENATILD